MACLLRYHRTRLHSTLAYSSPVQFEKTGLHISPSKLTHELGYGTSILEARSIHRFLLINKSKAKHSKKSPER